MRAMCPLCRAPFHKSELKVNIRLEGIVGSFTETGDSGEERALGSVGDGTARLPLASAAASASRHWSSPGQARRDTFLRARWLNVVLAGDP